MSRVALFALCITAACSKSAGNQDKVASPPPASSGQDVIAVPQGGPSMGPRKDVVPANPTPPPVDDRTRLKPEEGKLAVEPPADAKAGAEAVAKIVVIPGAGYHVNTEFPTKLTLTSPQGVALAKAQLVAGGHDKAKGDADALDEQQLAFAVKLTPAASGSYTINGDFRFAVCDVSQCLPKREIIAIAVAAK
ncbi:MAG TPA: hypothetical protein VHN14_13630 [Kofleriaceae bacterium]|jgi:hypothetical protein|nr:hypothetical protein [Kofleriaceae bacterium]